jgi:hypothetical protein
VTDARVEKVYADRVGAGEFLAQAELLLADADTASLSAASKAILLHNATVCACDAILQAVGLRVTPGDRSHILRLETALDQADDDTEELLERLDASRERRNEASYAAGFVAHASVTDAREATAEIIELSRTFVGDQARDAAQSPPTDRAS